MYYTRMLGNLWVDLGWVYIKHMHTRAGRLALFRVVIPHDIFI